MLKKQGKVTHRSMRGRVVDMTALKMRNQFAPSIGNTSTNARGDLLGPRGNIVIKREQIVQSYYKNNPNGVKRASIKEIKPETFETPKEAIDRLKKETTHRRPELDVPNNVLPKHKGRTLIHKKD